MKYDKAENRKKLHELLDIILDGNSLEARSRGTTGTLPTLFFDYSGHVANINIRLFKNGWATGSNWDKDWRIKTDEPITDVVLADIRATISAAMEDRTEAELLASDIAQAEKDLEERKKRIAQMKYNLKKMQRKEHET